MEVLVCELQRVKIFLACRCRDREVDLRDLVGVGVYDRYSLNKLGSTINNILYHKRRLFNFEM